MTRASDASKNGAMTLHGPRLPFSLDPLIAEAKRRARRRRWLGLIALVVAAAAVSATLELRSASGSGVATFGGKPVVHIVMETPPSTVYFNLKTGRQRVKTLGEEMWVDRQSNWHHIVTTEGGRRVADQLWKAHYGPSGEGAAVDRFYAALTTDFRAAIRSGMAKLVGRGTFDGQHVIWLGAVRRRDHRWYVVRELGEVGVDAHTYKPILMRYLSGKRYLYTRILLAKSTAYKPADFKRSGPRQIPAYPHQLAVGYAFGAVNRSARQDIVVRAPWLTAGTTVAGLKLRAVTPFTIRKTKHRFSYGAPKPKAIRGLALVYGPASQVVTPTVPTPINVYGRPRDPLSTARATIVYEVPAGNTSPWRLVPADSIEVQTGYTTVGDHVVRTPWIAYLKEQGLYVTISTPVGQHIPLQIARSLHTGAK